MNRVDRLTAIILLLQDRSHRIYTSDSLAEHFEVSRRTILRDMQAICEIGVPLIAQEGPGGGYSLPENYALPPTPLTKNESMLMLLSLNALEGLSDSPFAAERKTLRAKLKALVSNRHVSEVEESLDAISFDIPERQAKSPFIEVLLESARKRQWLTISYRSASRTSDQLVLPLELWTSAGFWYFRAYSHSHREERTYRSDRVLAAKPAEAPDEAPVTGLPYNHESHPEVCVRLTMRGVERVQMERHIGHAVETDESGGGTWSFRCPPSELAWFADYVIALGPEGEALAPPELRALVWRKALEIARRHEE
jgi:predicted DNA-binding transcriptional regulator YafY